MPLYSFRCEKCGYCEMSLIPWTCPECSLKETVEKCRELGKQQQLTVAVKNDSGKPDMTLVTYAMLDDAVKIVILHLDLSSECWRQ